MTPRVAAPPTIEALVARCLTDPLFLERAVRKPQSVLRCLPEEARREATGLDFVKMRRFSGFIGKVQHNYLWEHFPATRRLLWLRGIEHKVFGEYRKDQLDPLHALGDRPQRIRRFGSFLSRFLYGSRDELLRTVFSHEWLLWDLRSSPAVPPAEQGRCDAHQDLPWREFQRLKPKLSPDTRVVRFKFDPVRATARVLQADSAPPRIRAKNITLLYRISENGDLRLLELDPISGFVLASMRGDESVSVLISRVRSAGLGSMRPREFRPVFEEAARASVLRWEAPLCG